MDRQTKYGWALVLAAALLSYSPVALAESPEASEGGLSSASPGEGKFRFWPRRVFMEHQPDLLVQLSHPQRTLKLHLACEKKNFDINVPMWTHPEGLLHQFDLSWLPMKLNTVCDVSVSCQDAEIAYASTRRLVVKPGGPATVVTSVTPESLADDGEAVIDITGGAFTGVVNVLWISPSEYLVVDHSARSEPGEKQDRVVVPFSPLVSKAPGGQYLLVVENRDHSAAISGQFFTVTPPAAAEIVETRVQADAEGRKSVLILGVGLDQLHGARLHLEAGTLPLTLRPRTGFAVSALSVEMPDHFSLAAFRMADIAIADRTIEITVTGSSKLSRKE